MSDEINGKIVRWFLNGDVGVSSKAMVSFFIGINSNRPDNWGDHPHDEGDFRRCYNLLVAVPEFRDRVPELAIRSRKWAALVVNWKELSRMLLDNSNLLSKRIREILDSVEEKRD